MKLNVLAASAFKLSAFIDNSAVIEHLVSNTACTKRHCTGIVLIFQGNVT
jgi:hypothetical protein